MKRWQHYKRLSRCRIILFSNFAHSKFNLVTPHKHRGASCYLAIYFTVVYATVFFQVTEIYFFAFRAINRSLTQLCKKKNACHSLYTPP